VCLRRWPLTSRLSQVPFHGHGPTGPWPSEDLRAQRRSPEEGHRPPTGSRTGENVFSATCSSPRGGRKPGRGRTRKRTEHLTSKSLRPLCFCVSLCFPASWTCWSTFTRTSMSTPTSKPPTSCSAAGTPNRSAALVHLACSLAFKSLESPRQFGVFHEKHTLLFIKLIAKWI